MTSKIIYDEIPKEKKKRKVPPEGKEEVSFVESSR